MEDDSDPQFPLPNDQWEPATAPEGQLFLALHKGEFQYFTPNLSADSVAIEGDGGLEDSAFEAFNRLRRFDDDAVVVGRSVNHDDDNVETIIQHVEFDTTISDEVTIRLAQIQVVVEVTGQDGEERVALMLTLTAEADNIDEYVEDFEAFVRGVELA